MFYRGSSFQRGACPIGLIFPSASPAISGKVGGVVYARNRGGQYARARVKPTNPNTTRQASVRAAFGSLANTWSNTLSGVQRLGWSNYANNVTVSNRIGLSINLSGIAMFTKANSIRVQAGDPVIPDGPVINSLANFTEPDPTSTPLAIGDSSVIFAVDVGDEWQADGGFISLYTGASQNQSINFFRGPFQYRGSVFGGTATLSSVTLTLGAPLVGASGGKVPYRILSSAPDGRPSQVFNGVLDIA